MTEIHESYPFLMDDADLAAEITEYFELYKDTYRGVTFEAQLPELKLAIIQAGLAEQTRREVRELAASTREATRAADRTAQRSLHLAWAAVIVAALTFLTTIVIAFAT